MAWSNPLAHLIHAGVAACRGETASAIALLTSAEAGFEAAAMQLYAAVARYRRGQLIGGVQGRALIEAAEAWMTNQNIKNSTRVAAMLAPGRWPSI